MGPDGKERTIINVHVAAGEDNKALRDAQLAYIAQLAAAESKGPPAREVVVMGDLNTSTAEVEVFFKKAGLERAVGGTSGGPGEVEDFDQVWTTAGLDTHNSAQVETDGVSDHETVQGPLPPTAAESRRWCPETVTCVRKRTL